MVIKKLGKAMDMMLLLSCELWRKCIRNLLDKNIDTGHYIVKNIYIASVKVDHFLFFTLY